MQEDLVSTLEQQHQQQSLHPRQETKIVCPELNDGKIFRDCATQKMGWLEKKYHDFYPKIGGKSATNVHLVPKKMVLLTGFLCLKGIFRTIRCLCLGWGWGRIVNDVENRCGKISSSAKQSALHIGLVPHLQVMVFILQEK